MGLTNFELSALFYYLFNFREPCMLHTFQHFQSLCSKQIFLTRMARGLRIKQTDIALADGWIEIVFEERRSMFKR